jgi:hypothetical protein
LNLRTNCESEALVVSLRKSAFALVAVAATALLGVSGCKPVDGGGSPTTDSRTFAFAGSRLTIETRESGLRVETGTGKEVEVERSLSGKAGSGGNASWSMEGSTLKLSVNCSGVNVNCSADNVVRVPAGIAVEVKSFGSPVSVVGLAADLTANVADDGSLKVQDPAGALRLSSQGSNITVTGARSTDVTADASADGNVDLGFVTAPNRVQAKSHGGAVKVTLPNGPETYRLDLGGAPTNLTNDPASSRSITALADADGTVRVQKA